MALEFDRSFCNKWMYGVADKLSRHDGLQLLKILYHGDGNIAQHELDVATSVAKLNKLFKEVQLQEYDYVAVLYYRLGLLVPQYVPISDAEEGLDPSKLFRAKDLGAKDCLDYYDECKLPTPHEPEIPARARFAECFVMAYVNLSPRRRRVLKEQLAELVGVYRHKQFDLFNLFTRLCLIHDDEPANQLICALNNSSVPSRVIECVQSQFNTHHIAYSPLEESQFKTQEETEDDYIKDSDPLIYRFEQSRNRFKIKCTTSSIVCALLISLPILLFVLGVIVLTPTINTQNQSQNNVHMYETWNKVFENKFCRISHHLDPLLIRLGTLSTEWYDGIQITQISDKKNYEYKNLDIYIVPSDSVVEHSQLYTCEDSGDDRVELEVEGIYFLRGTMMTFNICVSSTDPIRDGWVEMDIYNTLPDFQKRGNETSTLFYIGANQTRCYLHNYTAPQDSFYYILLGAHFQYSSEYVAVIYYQLEAEMKYVNESDWLHVSQRTTCNMTGPGANDQSCKNAIKESLLNSFIPLEGSYQIFAKVTSPTVLYDFGHLSIMPIFRKESLAWPTIGGLVLLIPLELIVLCSIGIFIVVIRKRKVRIPNIIDAEELVIK